LLANQPFYLKLLKFLNTANLSTCTNPFSNVLQGSGIPNMQIPFELIDINLPVTTLILIGCSLLFLLLMLVIFFNLYNQKINRRQSLVLKENLISLLTQNELNQMERFSHFTQNFERRLAEQKESILQHLNQNNQTLQVAIRQGMIDVQTQMMQTLRHTTTEVGNQLDKLTSTVDKRLKEITGQVETKLSEGFEKTTATFTDIVKRLALIDDAQKKLTELSTNVIGLQAILSDKRSRGAFGEVQLNHLIQNMLPTENYAFQHTLANGMRVDCLLFLPAPTGNIAIDAKFPLENFQKMTDFSTNESDRKKSQQAFKQDIKKHIQDIATKYVIKGETSDGAIMFIPAEAVFAEIHGHFPDLVEFAQRSNIWLASPTTMMAILTTASSVLKDTATRKHIHIIQEHLRYLADDFMRFDERMNKLAKHIDQAQQDVKQVHVSAKKISQRFTQIEQVETATELLLDSTL